MFHRQALLDVGGFDPEWYHAEDMEVSLRLLNAGGSIVYAPDALVSHVPEVGVRRFLHKRRRDARAHVRIVRHHPSRQRTGTVLTSWWWHQYCTLNLSDNAVDAGKYHPPPFGIAIESTAPGECGKRNSLLEV